MTRSPILIVLWLTLLFAHLANGAQAPAPDPYGLLHRHYDAIGGLERLQRQRTSYSEGKIRYDGLNGTFRHWEKRPLQYRSEEDYTIISHVEGDSGEQSWFLDTNGQLLVLRDEETIKRRRLRLLLDRYEHLDPNSRFFSVHYGGITEVKETRCHELIISNTINSDMYHFFFDHETMVMVRSVVEQPDVEITVDFDDYRWIDGILVSFYAKTVFMPWEQEEEVWTTVYRTNTEIDEHLFELPEAKQGYRFEKDTTAVTLPFQLIGNLIYLPVEINGDTRTWVMDSGATMSVIDSDYARQLGLANQGSITGYGFGELFKLGFAAVPGYRVGDILFDRQIFYVAQDLSANSYEPVITGILGYDFLSRFVVELDYDRSLVTFHKPDSFQYRGSGKVLPAPLKYRTFTLPVTLEHDYHSRWTIDLGSYHSSIHYPFAQKHGLLNRQGVAIVSQGMSGISRETKVAFSCLEVGGFALPNHLISIPTTKGKGATALGEVGGNLGNSTLRHFHLFLNYPQQEVILEKGGNFAHRFARDKSGLLIGRSDDNQPMVSFLAPDSPAHRTGFQPGDIIVAIDNRALAAGASIMALRDFLRAPAGTTVTFTVERDGQRITLDLTLADLYPDDDTLSCTVTDQRGDSSVQDVAAPQ